MAKYDRAQWVKRKPDLTGKANHDVREQLFRENITFFSHEETTGGGAK